MGLHPRDLAPHSLHQRVDLLRDGMHPRHLADPSLMRRVLPGMVMRADLPASLRAVALALQQDLVPGAVFTHETALELFEVPLPAGRRWSEGATLHAMVDAPGGARRTTTFVLHRGTPPAQLRHHGLQLAEPLSALQQVACRWPLDDLVIAMDSLATVRHGAAHHVPIEELTDRVLAASGNGAPRLRQAIPLVRANVWSPMETRTRLLLLRRGFPEPSNNLPVVDPVTGKRWYIDLGYKDRLIAVEYDGLLHLTQKEQQAKDREKDEVLHRLGWAVLRLTADDLHQPDDALRRLDALFASRSATARRAG